MSRKKPNILFIHVDQLCLHTISAYGCEFVETPNIDKLIANGVSFMHNYSAEPICTPARSSWWTGKYPTEHGVVYNATVCHEDLTDLGQHLNKNGYNPLLVGKWHLSGRNVEESFRVTHEGSWFGEPTDPDVTQSATTMIRNYQSEKPFFLSVGYLNPHDCCGMPFDSNREGPPEVLADGLIDIGELPPLPETYHYDNINSATVDYVLKEAHHSSKHFTDSHWRYYLYQYARLCEMVDHEIGAVLHELEQSVHKDNTVILFTTDHGDGAACHKMYEKATLWDESVRVPLVIASLSDDFDIRKDIRDLTHFTSGVDIFPTVCDIAGIELPEGLSGISVYGAAVGSGVANPRSFAYAESVFYTRMIRSERFKYIMDYKPERDDRYVCPTHETHTIYRELLYDMDNEGERLNLADREDYETIVAEHRQMLIDMEKRLTTRELRKDNEYAIQVLHKRLKGYYDHVLN